MSGEGLSVSFRRTAMTKKSNEELLWDFQDLVYSNKKIMSHMKWYGRLHSVYMEEHGDKELQEWQQEEVAIKGTFRFCISVYESWYEDADFYESHETEGSFVSLAYDFAKDNGLMYFPNGFPAEWYEKNEEGKYQHFKVKPNDKNIDKICEIWYDASMREMLVPRYDHSNEINEAMKNIKQLMTK